MISTLRPLTYEDLRQMPDDGNRYEVIGGVLIMNPAPTANHQRVVGWFYRHLFDIVRQRDVGEVFMAPFDVRLDHFDVVQPDLIYLNRKERVPGGNYAIDGAPELVVEVISPSSRGFDRVQKMALYARAGVPEYWIADPQNRGLDVHALAGDEYIPIQAEADGRISSRILPGFRVDPAEVFAGLD